MEIRPKKPKISSPLKDHGIAGATQSQKEEDVPSQLLSSTERVEEPKSTGAGLLGLAYDSSEED